MMPDMDGFDVCDILRKDTALQTVPVIFLTALDDDTSRLKGLERMADDYLTKPFNSRLLLAKIENILHLSQMRSQVVTSQFNQQVKEKSKTPNRRSLGSQRIYCRKISAICAGADSRTNCT